MWHSLKPSTRDWYLVCRIRTDNHQTHWPDEYSNVQVNAVRILCQSVLRSGKAILMLFAYKMCTSQTPSNWSTATSVTYTRTTSVILTSRHLLMLSQQSKPALQVQQRNLDSAMRDAGDRTRLIISVWKTNAPIFASQSPDSSCNYLLAPLRGNLNRHKCFRVTQLVPFWSIQKKLSNYFVALSICNPWHCSV